MGLRGPQKKPDWLKVLDGNPGSLPVGNDLKAPLVRPSEDLPPPDFFELTDDEKKIWAYVCDALKKVHVLSQVDSVTLARYCVELNLYLKAVDHMRHTAKGELAYAAVRDSTGKIRSAKLNPNLSALLKISYLLDRAEKAFGMTPSARASFTRPSTGEDPSDIDPFA